MSFSARDLSKNDIKTTNCSFTGELHDFDVIQRKGIDDIMQHGAIERQSEDFARCMRDALEGVSALSTTR